MSLPECLQDFNKSSQMREGVLCWYPFSGSASVLDLSGGILTDLLTRRCGHVETTETTDKEFDYIVALDPADLSVDYLLSLRGKLTHDGRLLIAYENPFALRYWAGKKAPNTSVPYDTLFGRGDNPLPGKVEMCRRLEYAGLKGQKWYYPLTDHWLTTEVFSENYLPDEHLNQRYHPYITDDGSVQFDERELIYEVIRGGAFEFMCGAYMVEARMSGEPCVVDCAAITAYRTPKKRCATVIRNDGTVHKIPLHPDGVKTINKINQNHRDLAALGISVIETRIEDNALVMPRLSIPTLWDYWVNKLVSGNFDKDEMISHFDSIRESIYKAASGGRCYWELVPANCFYDSKSDTMIFFDQEYYWEDASPDIAVARAVKSFDYSPVFLREPRSRQWMELLKVRYNLTEQWDSIVRILDCDIYHEVFGTEFERYLQISNEAADKINARKCK